MMQIVPKWKVTAVFADRRVVVWIYDAHLSNVLRRVSDMQFTESGLEQPRMIAVDACDDAATTIQPPSVGAVDLPAGSTGNPSTRVEESS